MKSIHLIIIIIFTFISCKKEPEKWLIEGTTSLAETPIEIFLFENTGEEPELITTATISNNIFSFKGRTDHSDLNKYFLRFGTEGLPYPIYMRNGDQIKIDISEGFFAHYSGTPLQEEYNVYLSFKKEEVFLLQEASKIFENGNSDKAKMEKYIMSYQKKNSEIEKAKQQFISEVSSPDLSAVLALEEVKALSVIRKNVIENYYNLLSTQAKENTDGKKIYYILEHFDSYVLNHTSGLADYATLKSGYDSFDLKNKNSIYGKEISERLTYLERLGIGAEVPDLIAKKPDGEIFDLKKHSAKIILLDFWASWCGPCRLENPHYVKLYKELKGGGLEIVGYSLDTNAEKWENAIIDDQLNWINVSNLKRQNEDIVLQEYQVKAVPANLIIIDGKIVARNLFGAALDEFLYSRI